MNSKFILSLSDNFSKTFDGSKGRYVLKKYISLITEFMNCICTSIKIKDSKYYIFIIQRGLETIKHCFKMLFMYTKNIDLTVFHCKKAFCYYIEFIGQISDSSHTYLQLNSRDATLFVYKKTLFEINKEFKKNFLLQEADAAYLSVISDMLDIYHTVVLHSMASGSTNVVDRRKVAQLSLENGAAIVARIVKNRDWQQQKSVKTRKLIMLFVTVLRLYALSLKDYCSLCETFVNKLNKKDLGYTRLQKKLHCSECKQILKTHTALRFVNWLYVS